MFLIQQLRGFFCKFAILLSSAHCNQSPSYYYFFFPFLESPRNAVVDFFLLLLGTQKKISVVVSVHFLERCTCEKGPYLSGSPVCSRNTWPVEFGGKERADAARGLSGLTVETRGLQKCCIV